jgi:hypothetical protein
VKGRKRRKEGQKKTAAKKELNGKLEEKKRTH